MNFFTMPIVLFCLCAIGACHRPSTHLTTPEVDLCTLKSKPSEFSNRPVHVRAYIHRDPENFSIYDPRCNNDTFVWAEYDVSTDEKNRSMLRDALCQTSPCPRGEARVLVTGRLEGPSENGYGHLNDYHFKFVITEVNEASPVRP